MSDLIERQAAINAIENTECELLPEEWNELTNSIMAVPPAEPEPQWIPCSERLPEKNDRYLVWAGISFVPDHVDDPDMYYGISIAIYYQQDWAQPWRGNNVEEVLAWMPLPECYTGE